MKRLGQTRPFRGPRGEVLAGSIAEVGYLRLGGVEQWVMIRGESLANPPLILLAGGPGLSETAFFRYFNAPLEKSFTVVYWDQRGAGRSFDSKLPRASMTVEQFITDLDELVDVVCKRLGKKKVALLGHSWGSALGVLYAARFPEKVAAYVGVAQIGDCAAGESASYAFALAEAQRLGNRKAIEALRAIGPPPHRPEGLWVERMWASRLGGLSARAMLNVGRAAVGVPELSILDLLDTVRGFRFSIDAMWIEASRLNLLELAPALQMPVFFFLGRKDPWVRPETSVAYFDALTAPSKKLVWFEESRHEPFVDEPAKFNAAMAELVRPVLAPDKWEAAGPEVHRRPVDVARSRTPRREGETDRDAAIEFVERVFGALNRRDYSGAGQYFADDVTLTGAEASVLEGRDAVIEHFRHSDAALTDSSLEVVEVLAGQSVIGVQFVLTGTHTGAFDLGAGRGVLAPTGKQVAIPAFWAMTVKDGRITAVVHYWDAFRMIGLLGMIPAGEPRRAEAVEARPTP